MRTNKAYAKRLKLTKTGKLLARKPGLDHFNAKASRVSQLAKRKPSTIKMTNKSRSRFLVGL
jgi:ribosomal protein L35